MPFPFESRRRRPLFLLAAILAAFAVYGAIGALKTTSNRIIDWLPVEFEQTRLLLEFVSEFGSEEFLMVSWRGCILEDPRLEAMATELRGAREAGDPSNHYFAPVLTGPDVLADLQATPLNLDRTTALRRLEGLFVGADHQTTCLILALKHPPTVVRRDAVEAVYACADRVEGLAREQIRMAGSTLDGVAIDNASQNSIVLLTCISFAVILLLACLSLRSVGLALLVCMGALLNQQLTLAAIYYSGWHLDSVLLMAPPMVFVLSVSAAIHLVNYYQDACITHGEQRAPQQALAVAFAPCLLASLTTAIGLISLLVSYLVPLQKFGIYAATGLLLALPTLFLFLPACLAFWSDRQLARQDRSPPRASSPPAAKPFSWDLIYAIVSRGRFIIIALTSILLIVAGVGVRYTKGTAFLLDMFSTDARIVQDYRWLESNIGPLVPVEVILRLPRISPDPQPYETPMLDRMQWVRQLQQTIRDTPDIDAVVSAVTFAPEIPQRPIHGLRLAARMRRTALEKNLRNRRQELVRVGYLRETPDALWFRVSGHVAAGRRANYDQLMSDLGRRIAPVLQSVQEVFPDASTLVCGGVPLVQKTQRQMVDDLLHSFSIAFALITVTMVILLVWMSLRDLGAQEVKQIWRPGLWMAIGAGLVAMVPNVIPCLAIFGAMGWAGVTVEVGTVMTASAAMGIAVDDTLHFVFWFRRGITRGHNRAQAVRFAYDHCGMAMVQTTIICGLGLLVFAASQFGPTSRFAWLMCAMLFMALVADLIILPALLLSPLGRLFAGPRLPGDQNPAAAHQNTELQTPLPPD